MMDRATLIAQGAIVPHPELGLAIRRARYEFNPSVGPCLDLPWCREDATLTRGPLLPEWDPIEFFEALP